MLSVFEVRYFPLADLDPETRNLTGEIRTLDPLVLEELVNVCATLGTISGLQCDNYQARGRISPPDLSRINVYLLA